MKLPFVKIKLGMRIKDVPFYFERYELPVVVSGALLVFLIAGLFFYFKAYRTVSTPPQVSVQITKINRALFDKVLKDLEEKKQSPKDLPIIDPFK